MISPELLRRFPAFGQFNDGHQKNLAMICEEVVAGPGEILFEEGQKAEALYFLLVGSVDLTYTINGSYKPSERKEIPVCEVNTGELFGISALIEPHILTSTARCTQYSRLIRIDIQALRVLFEQDPELELVLMRRVAQVAIDRLHATRVQLAAAWA